MKNSNKIKLEASELFKKVVKQKTLKSGTVVLCYMSANLCSVLMYDDIGHLIASRCIDIGYKKPIRAKALKNLNKIYNEFKEILSSHKDIL